MSMTLLERLKDSNCSIHQLDELKVKIDSGKELKVKFGIDPTSPDVHLGHTVVLNRLRLFQEHGHKIIIIIGDFTAMIGDPTGRDQTRPIIHQLEIAKNISTYMEQIGKVINLKRANVVHNADWLSQLYAEEIVELTQLVTVQQLLKRKDFGKRIDEETPIHLHELLYGCFQAHDSVHIQADVEFGGMDQLFNLNLARDFQKRMGQEQQVCITVPILRGLDGKKRMGKSLKNHIGLRDIPTEMYAKVMSIPDTLLCEWFELLTDDKNAVEFDKGGVIINAMEAKKKLAAIITTRFHTEEAAAIAATEWHRRFSEGGDPAEIPEIIIPDEDVPASKSIKATKLLVMLGLVNSNTEARYLMNEKAVNVGPDRKPVSDHVAEVPVYDGMIVRVGKRRIARVRLGVS